MARTIAEIQAQIISAVGSDSTLGSQLTSTSATALWRLWAYIVAASIWALETLYDQFKVEIAELVAAQKPHTLRWYQQKALSYQHGGSLVPGEDIYDNTGLSDDDIAAQRIVKQAAAVENGDKLVIKVAKESNGALQPLSTPEVDGVAAYFFQIKDAGVHVQVRSVNPDHLKVAVDVYYDPTILGANGARLDGTDSTPVQSAAKAFLRASPFDGEFVKAHLTDAMQSVEGVIVPEIRLCQARRDDDPSFANVDVFYQPFSGFMKIYDEPSELVLTFIQA